MQEIVAVFFLLTVAFTVFVVVWYWVVAKRIRAKINRLAEGSLEMTPQEFFKMRNFSFGGRGHVLVSRRYTFAGVYIILNKSKNMYYVGQGQNVLDRVNNHFTGKGKGDVYADFKYGDIFAIKMIALEKSGFRSLNELERNTIMVYDACAKGYNKTRGNR